MDYKYYNDVHLFDMENRTWKKIDPAGNNCYISCRVIYIESIHQFMFLI